MEFEEKIEASIKEENVDGFLISNMEVLPESLHQDMKDKDPLLFETKSRKVGIQLFQCEFCEFVAITRNQFDIHQVINSFRRSFIR